MRKIELQLKLTENGDFIFRNTTDEVSFTVEYATKKLSAKSLFENLVYSQESKYVFLEDIIETEEVKMKVYFDEIKNVIVDISDSINDINFPKECEEETKEAHETELPF